jgi:threonine dehydrogenase-like Zn-dependent dehydrogenase
MSEPSTRPFIPDITEPNDVILQVTGSTICGSDLRLYHGEILTLQKGDILGHEVRTILPEDFVDAECKHVVYG